MGGRFTVLFGQVVSMAGKNAPGGVPLGSMSVSSWNTGCIGGVMKPTRLVLLTGVASDVGPALGP